MTKHIPPFSPEVRERAVRMVFEHQGEHASQWAAISSIAAKIGCAARDAARAGFARPSAIRAGAPARRRTSSERIKALEREIRELRQANEILRKATRVFCPWRSSTAGPSHDRLHRRASRRLRGRADLQGPADRPVDVSRPCRAAGRSRRGCRPEPSGMQR